MSKVLVIGYCPLIDPSALGMVAGQKMATTADQYESLVEMVHKNGHDGRSKAIMYVRAGEELRPIFVLDDAQRVFNHLMWWCNEKPSELFRLHLEIAEDGYTMFLIPDSKKAIERYKSHGEDTVLLTVPIVYVGETSEENISHKLLSKMSVATVGFVDTTDPNLRQSDTVNPMKNPPKVNWIKDIQIVVK